MTQSAAWHPRSVPAVPNSQSAIERVDARQILDSRGRPTIEVELELRSGASGRASVPSGASTGSHEAVELRDRERAFGGLGVGRATANVTGEIAAAVRGIDACDQERLDLALVELDGTADKRRLGANALLGVSLAGARAAAAHRRMPLWQHLGGKDAVLLPVPMFNVLNGGAHAANSVDFQEFMLVPHGARSFAEALRMGAEIYAQLARDLHAAGLSSAVGDEGGFAPDLPSNEAPIELVVAAIAGAGYRPGEDVALALDPAASELHRDGAYELTGEQRRLSSGQLVDYWAELIDRHPIVLLEDGMAEQDWGGWAQLTARLGGHVELVGDDVFVTNPAHLRRGVELGVANAIVIKPNQIGTLSETLRTMALARESGYRMLVSHRSGETDDAFIADLAVATGCGQIKAGAPARGERVAKYNRLLWIEQQLGARARFAGRLST